MGGSRHARFLADIGLNEGFATYFELLFAEHLYGTDVLREGLALRDSVYKAHPELDGSSTSRSSPSRVLSFVMYNKGARVLHMLRSISRLQGIEGGPVRTRDLDLAAVEATAGSSRSSPSTRSGTLSATS